MKKTTKDLKYIIYTEWSSDPPAGDVTAYYDLWGNTYKELYSIVGTLYDNASFGICDEDKQDELIDLYNKTYASSASLQNYEFDGGSNGFYCQLFAKGAEIAPQAIDFLKYRLDYECDDDESQAIIENASAHPDDYAAVIALLKLVSDKIENHNDGQW